jgi:propanol-preferring alcohol dehydrogenase
MYTALKRANARFGSWVLIAGAGGGLGHLGIQYAKALGTKVLALDMGVKEQLCRSLGADEFVDFTKFTDDASLATEIKKLTGGGARTVLMCSSSTKAYDQAVGWLGFRGTLVCLGVPEGVRVPIGGAIVEPMIAQELTIFGKIIRSQSDITRLT